MAGYTRQSTFADGDTITAALFNNEYNQVLNAFSNTGGHKHDGTANEGPVIGIIGDAGETSPNNKVLIDTTNNYIEFYVQVSGSSVQQLYIADGAIIPVTDSDVDLGTTGLRFKDAYIDTVTTTGNVAVGGNLTVTGTTTFNGGTITMGDAATDNVVFGADVDSNIIPDDDDSYDLGSSTQEWRNLYIDGTAHIDTLDVDVNATIAGTLGVTGVLTGTSLDISGDIDVDGTTNLDVVDIDGAVDMATTLTVGGEIAAASLDISGNVDVDGTLETDALSINGTAVTSTAAELNLLDGKAFLDEDNMASNSATGIASQQSIKAYVDTQITAEDLDITTDSGTIAIDLDSETLTVSGGTGLDSSATGNAVTLAIDSTVVTLTGSQTLTNKSLTAPTLTGTAVVASLDISGDIDVDGTTNLDVVDIDGAVDFASTTAHAGNATFADSAKAIFGAGSDLQIYHDGSNSIIDDAGTGNLFIRGTNINIQNLDADPDENMITAVANGAVTLLHNNAAKLATTSTGIDVTGTATIDGGSSENTVLTLDSSTANTYLKITDSNSTNGAFIGATTNDLNFYPNNVLSAKFAAGGDISFYNAAGSSQALFWDASTERLGIGTTSPNQKLNVSGGRSYFGANNEAYAIGVGYNGTRTAANQNYFIGATDATAPDLQFSNSDGGEKVRITHAGNVGIGTTSPTGITSGVTSLSISDTGSKGNGDKNGVLSFKTDDASYTNTYSDGVTAEINSISESGTGAAYGLGFVTGTITSSNRAERVRISATGDVGIGVTAPAQALDVSGNILSRGTSTEDRFIEIGTGRSGNGYAFFDLVGDATYTDYGLRIIRNNSGANTTSVIQHRGTGTLGLLTQEAAPIHFSTSNTERMRITDDSVGIGTSVFTNSYKTYIEGLDQDTANLTDSGNHGATLYLRATANAAGSGGAVAFGTTFGNKTPFAAIKGHVTDGATNTVGDLCFSTRASVSATALTERIRLSASGKVGIGNSSPTRNLVIQTSDQTDVAIIAANDQNSILNFGDTDDDNVGRIQYNHATNLMTFRTNTADAMHINSSGNVGIGTSSPTVGKLQVNDGSGAITALTRTSGSTSGDLGTIRFGNTDVDSNLVNIVAFQDGATNSGALKFETQASGGATTERMRIDSSGNVGIGSSSPSANLSLGKSIGYNADSALFSDISINDTAVNNNAVYRWRTGMTGNATGHSLTFSTLGRTESSYVERMRIDSSGNVGIGISSPDTKLHVYKGSAGSVTALSDSTLVLENSTHNYLTFLSPNDKEQAIIFGDAGSNNVGSVGYNHNTDNLGISAADDIIFYTSGTTRGRFTDNGLCFNADTAAGNALDDYEEGTATLTLASTGTSPTIAQGNTFTIAYTKIGNLVRFVGYTAARNITNAGTGSAKITGLPFAQAGSYYGQVTFTHNTMFTDTVTGYIESGNTFFYPIIMNTLSTGSYPTGIKYLMVQGLYHTA